MANENEKSIETYMKKFKEHYEMEEKVKNCKIIT